MPKVHPNNHLTSGRFPYRREPARGGEDVPTEQLVRRRMTGGQALRRAAGAMDFR
jgi:hypothetical protein